jgi:pyruvate/2-oxoglutarate dehydrogenase complex dihydrolipoamide acyltransferase (E2) component
VSPRLNTNVSGSGPGGQITRDDIQARLNEVAGGAQEQVAAAKPTLTYAAVGGALLVIGLAFILGRRRGRRRSTVVEIRRV